MGILIENRDRHSCIPDNWMKEGLENIASILDGKRKPIKKSERVPGGIPYYGATGVIDWVNDYIFDEELILVGEDGENLKSRVLPMAFKISGKTWVNNHAHVIKPSNNIDINYLTYYLESISYEDYITGSAQPKLNQAQLKKIPVVYPPLKEQQKIADILSTVDEQIENTEQLIEKTKELKKGLMQRLLTKGIGHTKFKQTDLGEIPEEWEVKKIGDFCKVKSSKRIHQKDYVQVGVPFFRSKEVKELANNRAITTEIYITKEKYDEIKSKFDVPKKGDILITSVGTIGDVWISDGREFYYKDGNLTQIVRNDKLEPVLIKYLFNSPLLRSQYLNQSNGSAQMALTIEKINKLNIVVPSKAEQKKIISILSAVDEQITSYEKEREKYMELKKGLMQQLLTGKKRVTV